MKNNDNQYYIYIRSTKERLPCTEEEFHNYYRDISVFRRKQQRHGRCVCPENKRLDCDMDCATCPFRRAGDGLSLDYMAFILSKSIRLSSCEQSKRISISSSVLFVFADKRLPASKSSADTLNAFAMLSSTSRLGAASPLSILLM